MANTNLDTMRIYDFNVLKKSMKIKDVSGIDEYEIPVGKLPRVKNQKDYSCCVACALAEVFSIKLKRGNLKSCRYHIFMAGTVPANPRRGV